MRCLNRASGDSLRTGRLGLVGFGSFFFAARAVESFFFAAVDLGFFGALVCVLVPFFAAGDLTFFGFVASVGAFSSTIFAEAGVALKSDIVSLRI